MPHVIEATILGEGVCDEKIVVLFDSTFACGCIAILFNQVATSRGT